MNESGAPVFTVQGEIFTFGAKIHLYDAAGQELFFIQQKLFRFLPEYHIYSGDTLAAIVKKELTLFRNKLSITSQYGDYTFDGNFLAMDFAIYNQGLMVGELHKKWLTFGDSYELTIYDEDQAAFFCAIAIAIDHCLHNESK
jgi:uncharacterized protein YxjI